MSSGKVLKGAIDLGRSFLSWTNLWIVPSICVYLIVPSSSAIAPRKRKVQMSLDVPSHLLICHVALSLLTLQDVSFDPI
jgi:hypothetical protein